eukprot:CAMPEP_0181053438 /NCGR_PEP_ID=MMETSP1070-20121207/18112_1 /TAXON_ID=265543 /ORGANISM="Minutocellus polymorphus, Strain NH13" /LENGTH=153 /DNA_ID=CAMNT_0023132575 /DNA_START=96 /DNA_END=558 /DNA_ORIENTATION=-
MSAYHNQLRDLSNFCAMYSITGILFMLWVWLLVTHQPFFVGGIMREVDTYRNSAHGAMWMFVGTFTASMIFLYYDANRHQVDAQIAEAMMTRSQSHPLLGGVGGGRRLRMDSHDSGSDDGSYARSDDDQAEASSSRVGAYGNGQIIASRAIVT